AQANPDGELAVANFRTSIAGYRGQLKQAHELSRKAQQIAERLQFKEVVAGIATQQAGLEGVAEKKPEAVKWADEALKLSSSSNVKSDAAIALGAAGEDKRASVLADQVAAERPNDTLVQFVGVPLIRSIVEMGRGNTSKAMDLLDTAAVY